MKNYAHYIGADVSKKTVDIHVLTGKEKRFHLRISNDEKGFKTLEKALKKHNILAKESLFCLENTGLYGWGIASWAVANQHSVWVENGIAIKRSLGLVRGKTIESMQNALPCMRCVFKTNAHFGSLKERSLSN